MLIFLGSSSAVSFAVGVFFLLNSVSDIQLTAAVAAFGAGAILAGLTAVYHHVSRTEAIVRELLAERGGSAVAVQPIAPHGMGVSQSAC